MIHMDFNDLKSAQVSLFGRTVSPKIEIEVIPKSETDGLANDAALSFPAA